MDHLVVVMVAPLLAVPSSVAQMGQPVQDEAPSYVNPQPSRAVVATVHQSSPFAA